MSVPERVQEARRIAQEEPQRVLYQGHRPSNEVNRDVLVITADLDGAELKRAKRYGDHIRLKGSADQEELNDAMRGINKGKQFSIPGHLWERIFRRET